MELGWGRREGDVRGKTRVKVYRLERFPFCQEILTSHFMMVIPLAAQFSNSLSASSLYGLTEPTGWKYSGNSTPKRTVYSLGMYIVVLDSFLLPFFS